MKYNKDILNRFIDEKVAINVETQQEWDEFMELLEKETDCKWGGRERPTDLDFWSEEQEETAVTLNYSNDNVIEYCDSEYYQSRDYEIIKYKDLIKRRKQNESRR